MAIGDGAFRLALLGKDLRAIGDRLKASNSKSESTKNISAASVSDTSLNRSVEFLFEPWYVPLR